MGVLSVGYKNHLAYAQHELGGFPRSVLCLASFLWSTRVE